MSASSVSGACDGAGGCDAEAAQANAVACSGGSAEVRPVVSPTAASSSILQPRSASRKRALEEDPTPTRRSDPPRRVSFSHVRVREHAIDVGGGGGVPSDDGPPLGLGWDIKGEHTTAIDDYEDERERERTPKDSYCMEGCVEPEQRKRMLLGSGSTLKQIKAATKAVVQLNHDRWKASELLFGDAWLFRADRQAESTELLAMLGQPDGCGAELCVGNWDSAEACARELAGPLQVSPCELLSSASEEEDASEESGSVEEGLLWARASSAMQALGENVVLMIRCNGSEGDAGLRSHGLGNALLGRLVGCVAHSHIASQVVSSTRGKVSIVLRGWADDKIEADWSDEESDEFCISPLH